MLRLAAFSFVLAAPCLAASAGSGPLGGLRAGFRSPPPEARLQTWWHWIDDEYTPETCRADVDAMHEFGIGTAHVFAPGVYFPINRLWRPMLSEKWLEMFRIALVRAKGHGMSIGFHNCPGWSSSGGPWVKPEDSMKIIVAGETDLSGGETEVVVPRSSAVRRGFHRDIALLAVQVPDDPRPICPTNSALDFHVAAQGSSDSSVFEFAAGAPRFASLSVVYSNERLFADVEVDASADGHEWKRVYSATVHFHTPQRTPMTMLLGVPPAFSRFWRITYRNSPKNPAHIPPCDVRLASAVFSSAALVGDIDKKNGAYGHGLAYAVPAPDTEGERGLDRRDVRDISRFMSPDGRVDLRAAVLPPPRTGFRWRLLRVGYTTSDKRCGPATLSGLEVDKLDKSGLDAHWPHMPALLAAQPGAKGVLKSCIIDSYEAGGQNWTERMPERFRAICGYDLMPMLPALLGYVTGTRIETEKFLYDFQRTVSVLFVTEYYSRFADLCRRQGFTSIVEGYDGPYDPLEACCTADVPCGEFWVGGTGASNARVDKTPTWAASAAHLRGRPLVAAESFTTGAKEGRWQVTPEQLRTEGDRAWMEGISQLVMHSYVAQPFENVRPGYSLASHGSHMNRNTTWWKEGRAWSDYVARGQFLLQSGLSHSELLVLSGDSDAYACMTPPEGVAAAGMTFDWIPASLLAKLEVHGGKVGVPGLEPYEVLSLGSDRYLRTSTLRELKRLMDEGASIVAKKPIDTPSLADDPAEWKRLVDDIFRRGDLDAPMPRPYADSRGRLRARRRTTNTADIYFLLNDSDDDFAGDVSFAAQKGVKAELWKAEDASMTPLQVNSEGDGRVAARICLKAHRSVFVVLSRRCRPFAGEQPRPQAETLDISRGWKVRFDGPGACGREMAMESLSPWNESDDFAIRHFSGRAVYTRSFSLDPAGGRVFLDLGDVHDLASVRVNGRDAGVYWERPFRGEITRFVVEGENTLEITVVNCWPNRMIGDAIVRRRNPSVEPDSPVETWFPPEASNHFSKVSAGFPQWVVDDRPDSGTGVYTWSNYAGAWSADEKPLPAGLEGPVVISRESGSE